MSDVAGSCRSHDSRQHAYHPLPKMQKQPQAKPKVSLNPVAYTVQNKRVLPLKPYEARKLIAHGYAEWRGRKDGIAITIFIPINALLAFVGQERLKSRPEARALDSKTHTFTGANTYRHIRNEAYAGGVTRLVDVTERAA
jgi:hypothetical protein